VHQKGFSTQGITLGGVQRIAAQFYSFTSTRSKNRGGFFHLGLNNSIKATGMLKDLNGIRETQRQNL
jgi:hypothetical protein